MADRRSKRVITQTRQQSYLHLVPLQLLMPPPVRLESQAPRMGVNENEGADPGVPAHLPAAGTEVAVVARLRPLPRLVPALQPRRSMSEANKRSAIAKPASAVSNHCSFVDKADLKQASKSSMVTRMMRASIHKAPTLPRQTPTPLIPRLATIQRVVVSHLHRAQHLTCLILLPRSRAAILGRVTHHPLPAARYHHHQAPQAMNHTLQAPIPMRNLEAQTM